MSPRIFPLLTLLLVLVAGGGGYWMGTRFGAPPPAAPVQNNRAPTPPVPKMTVLRDPTTHQSDQWQGLLGKLLQGDRLHRVTQFIDTLQRAKFQELKSLAQAMDKRERTGYELSVERQLLLYRCGQLDGPYFIREKFDTNADHSVRASAIILEGWASVHPTYALNWWRSLPSGRMKHSLLEPLVQGYLTNNGGNWQDLAASLDDVERSQAIAPLIEGLIQEQGTRAAMDWYEKQFSEAPSKDYAVNNLAAHLVQEHALRSASYEELMHWGTMIRPGHNPMADSDLEALHRALGAKGGAMAMELVGSGKGIEMGLGAHDRSRLAYGWARARPEDAGAWVKANPQHSMHSDVAFHVAMNGVSKDPAAARLWLPFIDEPLKAQAEAIIQKYEPKPAVPSP